MVGLIDCDNFFCSCERVFRPDLNNQPIVVLSNNDGCVVARSKEAKDLGIPEGLPFYQMRNLFGEHSIAAFSSNYTLYGDMSSRVMEVLRSEIPIVEQYSIDEAFLDLSGLPTSSLKNFGEHIVAKVKQWTGLPVSLGIASSRTLAKVASKFAKKHPGYNKCCLIATHSQRIKALGLIPIGDVWGIGRRSIKKLSIYGVKTALDFATKPRYWIKNYFTITGERTWRELNGENVITIDYTSHIEKKTILTSRSFPESITTLSLLSAHVANHAARCAEKLRKQNSVCDLLTVFVESNRFRTDQPQYSNSATSSFATSTNATPQIVEAALHLLTAIFKPGIFYKRAGVMVSAISSASQIQPDLFTFDPIKNKKLSTLCRTCDNINSQLGPDTIVLAAQHYGINTSDGKTIKFANAIRRSLKSPDYTTAIGNLIVR